VLVTNQALINIHASSTSYTDVNMNKGELIAKFPNTIVHELTGKIVALGDEVTTCKIGRKSC
jgi:D-arabinose 1-dehydrogenase-like Zn-dependent alcohol dehydrogenase